MSSPDASAEAVTLWRPTGQAEIDLVAASGWRAWPPRLPEQPIFYPVLNCWHATKIAREWNVPRGGVGYVTRFDVRQDYLDRFPVQQAGGRDVLEYWIPAEELDELNASITSAIMEDARYLGPVPDEEFTAAEADIGCQFPGAWRDYLQGQSWLSKGWLESGCYLTLMAPRESFEWGDAWQPAAQAFPGLVILGTNGSGEMLAVDGRDSLAPVVLIGHTTQGWADATPQMPVGQFIAQVEAGTFDFTWDLARLQPDPPGQPPLQVPGYALGPRSGCRRGWWLWAGDQRCHASRWASQVTWVRGPDVDCLDLAGLEPVPLVAGIADTWWRGPGSLVAVYRGEASCFGDSQFLRALRYDGIPGHAFWFED